MPTRDDRVAHKITNREDWLRMRERNIGASDVGALFHADPHKTALRIWGEKRGELAIDDADSAALRRGRILEPAVAEALREAHPEWIISPARQYVELTSLRLGATPDFYAWHSVDSHDAGDQPFLIQAKTVIPEVWESDWTPSPPAHYLLQIQAEMLVTGCWQAMLVPMVLDGREFPIYEYSFTRDTELGDAIEAQVTKFWKMVADGREPSIKAAQDGATLAKMFPEGDGQVLALHGDGDFVSTCRAYRDAQAQIKTLQEAKEALGCKLMNKLRNHGKAEAQDFKVHWTTIAGGQRVQNVKPHRRLVVNERKAGK
jgi:predicted phage-related endonuclease